MRGPTAGRGFALVELLMVAAITALVLAALSAWLGSALRAEQATRERNAGVRDARFAMDRMVRAVGRSRRLVVPLPDRPDTAWDESRNSALGLLLDPELDRDGDGFADADNDRDGRVDEDPGKDLNRDECPGLCGIDDNANGLADVKGDGDLQKKEDDDEDGHEDEDARDGTDDDGDGIDGEDPPEDLNDDGEPGVRDVDDDGDTLVDEGNKKDDDEDGLEDEDWEDTVAFHLQGTSLIERNPVPWDANGDLVQDGRDFVEESVAENVTFFEVRRVVTGSARSVLVEITLEAGGARLSRHVRVGGTL